LRTARLARSAKPFMARGGFKQERCAGCRLLPSHCMCALRPSVPTRAGVCLLMADIETLKPSNTGWLIADVVADTFAFGWARTETDAALLALLGDPQWQPYVVFPRDYAAPERVVHTVAPPEAGQGATAKRPLFILLDGTWAEARKMFRKTPLLDALPVLHLQPDQVSAYRLRRSRRAAPHPRHRHAPWVGVSAVPWQQQGLHARSSDQGAVAAGWPLLHRTKGGAARGRQQ
jgi:DTW domain-containing protein YfiP